MPEHPDGPAPMPHRHPSGRTCFAGIPQARPVIGLSSALAVIAAALLLEDDGLCGPGTKKKPTPYGPFWER